MLTEIKRRKIERALARRFGESLCTIDIVQWSDFASYDLWRATDPENGAQILAKFEAGRLRVFGERAPL